jgi:hypothetical protein
MFSGSNCVQKCTYVNIVCQPVYIVFSIMSTLHWYNVRTSSALSELRIPFHKSWQWNIFKIYIQKQFILDGQWYDIFKILVFARGDRPGEDSLLVFFFFSSNFLGNYYRLTWLIKEVFGKLWCLVTNFPWNFFAKTSLLCFDYRPVHHN